MNVRRAIVLAHAAGGLAILFVVSLAWPSLAHAHLVQTGFGEFYDGIGHLVLTLPDLFVVIAIGLLAGASGKPTARVTLVALPLVWLVAGLAGRSVQTDWVPPWTTTVLFGVFGALVAADRKLSPPVAIVASAVAGLLHGWSNGAVIVGALGDGGAPAGNGVLALIGIVSGVFVIVTIASALVVPLTAHAARIAVRVAGSWLTAISILMLGWLARGRDAA